MFFFAKTVPLYRDIQTFIEYAVAPHVGAWIETKSLKDAEKSLKGRTPCGCVELTLKNILKACSIRIKQGV